MDKTRILQAAKAQLRATFQKLDRASRDTRAAATNSETRAEDKYDTRSIEENYLADGQALQAQTILEAIATLDAFHPPALAPGDPVTLGAFVELAMERRGDRCFFLLTPAGGGEEVALNGREITLITPETPLARQLLGRRVGATIADPPATLRAVS